jgi:hypothetical protein
VGYPQAEEEFDKRERPPARRQQEYREVSREGLSVFYTSFLFVPRPQSGLLGVQVEDCPNSSVRVGEVSVGRQCFELPNVDLLGTMRRVGLKNFVDLWKSLLLERHILV